MTKTELLAYMRARTDEMLDIADRKNSDYAGAVGTAFSNFDAIETISSRISAEHGIIVRMSDKLKRLASLLEAEAKVEDESFYDTCMVFAILP